jgi:hypothetical protein
MSSISMYGALGWPPPQTGFLSADYNESSHLM